MKALRSIAFVLALAAAGCSHGDNSTPTTPSVPTTTDTFTGTVTVRGSDMHTFTVSQSGQVSVTLTAVSPPGIPVGVGIGTPANSICGLLAGASVTTAAGTTAQLTGLVSPGMLCVAVFDVGNQTGPVSYTVTVVHP